MRYLKTSAIFSLLLIGYSSITLASPPLPSYYGPCCLPGDGSIPLPPANSFVRPNEHLDFQYYPRSSGYAESFYFSLYLIAAPLGDYASDSAALFDLLSGNGNVTGYYYGRYRTNAPSYEPDGPPTSIRIPDFSQPPWNSGPVSDLRMSLFALEEWSEGAQYDNTSVGTRLGIAQIPMTYNQSIPAQFADFPCPTHDKANGTCGCIFDTECNISVSGPTGVPVESHADDRATCRDRCDSLKTCDYYNYFELAPETNCFLQTFGEYSQYTDLHFYQGNGSEGGFIGVKNQTCKASCI